MSFKSGRDTSVDLSATVTSEGFVIGQDSKVSVHAVISNTNAVGTLGLESSNDGSNWVAVAFEDENGVTQTTLAVASGVDTNHMFIMPAFADNHLRYVYTSTSGAATGNFYALKKRY